MIGTGTEPPTNEVKIDIKKTEAVEWTLKLESGSNKVVGKLSYTDEHEGWFARAPLIDSPHPDVPALLLKTIEPKRVEGGIVEVSLSYESNDPDATYPGREAGKIKRYNLELTSGEEPLLKNHLFKDISSAEQEVLQGLLNSSKAVGDFSYAVENTSSEAAGHAIAKIRKGIDAFLNPGMIWVERFTTKDLGDLEISKILTTTSNPPGGCPSGGATRNWLYLGGTAGQSQDGKSWDIEKRWQLSEKGKWDIHLYPAG
ncbi:MAG: hypothetical protein V4819_19160 [Verrucomicrobiota bacterium]